MRAALALALCILPASAAFAADPSAGDAAASPPCRLSPTECARALHELAADADAMARDGEILGLGLPAADRARALLRRDDERMADRLRHLPPPIAREVTRLGACRALDGAGPRDRPADPDPLCR